MFIHFILNPNAGNGRGQKKWRQFQPQLTIPYELHETKYAGHTCELARSIARTATKKQPVCIISIGGDGTLHEVVNGIATTEHVYIGAIAAGSGNDFARGYRVFRDAKQIEQFVVSKQATVHDVGVVRINDYQKRFINNFGIGFDALVASIANESQLKKKLNKWKLGKLSYPYFVIQALFTFQPFQLTAIHNGKREVFNDVWFATVSNQPFFGGGMNLSPTSNTQDGKLEVTVVSNLSKWKLLFLFGSVFFAKHTQMKEVHQFEVEQVQFEFQYDQQVMSHADGEKQQLQPGTNVILAYVNEKAWYLAK